MKGIITTLLDLFIPTVVVLALWDLLEPKTVVEILEFSMVAIALWVVIYAVFASVSD